MTVETLPFDSARHLETEEDIALYLEAVLAEDDPHCSAKHLARWREPRA